MLQSDSFYCYFLQVDPDRKDLGTEELSFLPQMHTFKESDVLQRETLFLPERTSIFNKLKAPLSQKLNSTQPTSNIRVHIHCPQAKR